MRLECNKTKHSFVEPRRSEKTSRNEKASNLWSVLPVSVSFDLVLVRNDEKRKAKRKRKKIGKKTQPNANPDIPELKKHRLSSLNKSSCPCDSSHPAIHSGSR
jgi:hypothetical protein